MGKFLAKVGRDPKTCAAQIAAFCGTASDKDYSDQDKKNAAAGGGSRRGQSEERRRGADAGDGGERTGESKSEADGEEKSHRRGGRQQRVAFAADGPRTTTSATATPSMASFAEILAAFGFVFEGAGAAVKPSVAEAFAMLRLHAQPAEARTAGEAVKR